ncbi:uncharacterized protein LOC110730611 [Chenopodium quinoa]|uniref:uncharacterized protein LOC110730611 n=1 Tax=Chenopodium quinoa TaxID=63459 RepID=UPI000B7971A0|nr:uncharacterized protein LOC110730611 [Chenopodium quinoa]
MASKKKEPEVFNLLNLYQDDDDEEEDEDVEKERESESQPREELRGSNNNEDEDMKLNDEVGASNAVSTTTTTSTTTRFTSNSTMKWSSLKPPTPVQAQSSVLDSDVSRQRREKPTIVDYAHDDVAMSPEDGEILGTSAGRVTYGEELTITHDIQQRTIVTNVQIMTSNNPVDFPQLSAHVDVLQLDHSVTKESEAMVGEGVNLTGEDGIGSDPLQKFLRPPPEDVCSDELQEKINRFLALKRQGKSFNVEVRNRKDYRNPDFLRHAVRYQDIDEIGSCFSRDVFDPHGYDESDYFDAIEADMKREMERKEQERKKNQKVDFVSGGTQAGMVSTSQKVMPSPGVTNLPSSGSQSGSADMLTREGRQNKKSKWDKVDGDRRNVTGSGQESLSAIGAHAALLSAANAGAGYAAFAQQKRREAEERRTSDRKAERRT